MKHKKQSLTALNVITIERYYDGVYVSKRSALRNDAATMQPFVFRFDRFSRLFDKIGYAGISGTEDHL